MRRTLQILAPTAALVVCLYLVDLPLFVIGPGPPREVTPLIDIEGTPTYQPDGRLLLTTVTYGRANVYDVVATWIDPDARLVSERDIIPPGQSDRQYEQISLSQMDGSKVAAVAVALEELTDYPRDHRPGVIVQGVAPGTPAAGSLFPGDLITSVDGSRLEGVSDLTTAIDEAGSGRSLTFTVRPVEGGDVRTVRLRPEVPAGDPDPVIGIYVVDNYPFPVRIDSGQIGGPSAGLMWALGVTDLLTPGELTGGRTLAGTGDVGLDGRVAPIGGIRLKIAAAEEAGADAFLFPRANLGEAEGAGENIVLVPVATVADAIRYLEDGG